MADLKDIIFVFGSNRQGRHGKGDALLARKNYGAVYGQAEGLQGNSYAIITKELRPDHKKVTLKEIKEGVKTFLKFAKNHPEMTFYISAIGCGLAGRTPKQIGPMFWKAPRNVILPKPFRKYVRSLEDRFHVAWRKRYGNLPAPVRQYKFHPERQWPFDFAWPELKLGVEIQGGSFTRGRHNRGFHQAKDYEKYNAAARMGWRILFFNTAMFGLVDSGKIWDIVDFVAEVITNAKEVE